MIQPTNQSQRSRPSREALQTIPSFSPAVRCKPGKAASENPFLSTLGQVSTQPNNDLFTGEKMYFMKHGTYTVVLVCERGYGRSSPNGLKRYCFWGGGELDSHAPFHDGVDCRSCMPVGSRLWRTFTVRFPSQCLGQVLVTNELEPIFEGCRRMRLSRPENGAVWWYTPCSQSSSDSRYISVQRSIKYRIHSYLRTSFGTAWLLCVFELTLPNS
jgi:hypothetical protein